MGQDEQFQNNDSTGQSWGTDGLITDSCDNTASKIATALNQHVSDQNCTFQTRESWK